MTTPEIDVAPSTVEGGDKPGANSPVDAAPPKDPVTEIDARRIEYATACERMGMAHANGTRAEWETAASDEVATRTAILSSVRALAARVEEAEQEAERQRNLWESIRDARVAAAESSLERMREEYRRVKGALQCLDLGASNRNAYVEHAMLCDARFSNAPCECGYAEVEAIQRECSACPNEAHEDGLCDSCHGFSPSTPETKDDR